MTAARDAVYSFIPEHARSAQGFASVHGTSSARPPVGAARALALFGGGAKAPEPGQGTRPVSTCAARTLYRHGQVCLGGAVPSQSQKSFVAGLAVEYGQRLRRFLSTRARNAEDISDLSQEVFLRLMRVHQHEFIRNPEAYLFTVASHVAHQHALRESSIPKGVDVSELVAELQLASLDDPVAYVETQQRLRHLQGALDQLPPKLATALLLHRFAGLSIEEIGDRLGVARVTAKKYLAQALLHCRNGRAQE
jgi:RNA polymerase sigma factor (sigma-70 family)